MQRVDLDKISQEEMELMFKQSKLLFKLNHTEPMTEEYDSLLNELLDGNIVVVCFINYDISPQTKYLFQDICIARRINQCYQFDARGISYATWYADFPYTFEEMCEANGVEYIEPTNMSN